MTGEEKEAQASQTFPQILNLLETMDLMTTPRRASFGGTISLGFHEFDNILLWSVSTRVILAGNAHQLHSASSPLRKDAVPYPRRMHCQARSELAV